MMCGLCFWAHCVFAYVLGSVAVWQCGCVAAGLWAVWRCDCVAVWLRGCVAAWLGVWTFVCVCMNGCSQDCNTTVPENPMPIGASPADQHTVCAFAYTPLNCEFAQWRCSCTRPRHAAPLCHGHVWIAAHLHEVPHEISRDLWHRL